MLDSSDEFDDDNEADAVAAADNATDVDENTGDDASDLETEPTVPKASTIKKVAVPKTSKKRGSRGPYKKKSNNSFFTLFFTQLLYYYVKTTFLFYQLLNS